MTIPLLILAAGTILGGLINLPGLSPLQSWLFPLLEEQAGAFQFVVASLTVVLAVLGGWFDLGYLPPEPDGGVNSTRSAARRLPAAPSRSWRRSCRWMTMSS